MVAAPRHVFVPATYQQDNSGAWQPVDVTSASGLDLVCTPTTLVTALADRGTHQEAVSTSTKPDLMLRMLETLDVHDGHKVLEIGTGTGYNTALLSHRLGANLVFSVDIDAELLQRARSRLHAIGFRPTLVTADGANGLPEHATFDPIIVTCLAKLERPAHLGTRRPGPSAERYGPTPHRRSVAATGSLPDRRRSRDHSAAALRSQHRAVLLILSSECPSHPTISSVSPAPPSRGPHPP